jgi:hypothetical protein
MKTFSLLASIALVSGLNVNKHPIDYNSYPTAVVVLPTVSTLPLTRNVTAPATCQTPLDITQKELDVQLDYFSRTFDKHHYENAMNIYNEMKKKGTDPIMANGVHTWELYDHAFPFEKVRRYDLVQQHMDAIQHFEDNLNQNMQNGQAVDQFVIVAKAAQVAINAKYHNGEFSDPALFDPVDDHPTTWSSAKFGN